MWYKGTRLPLRSQHSWRKQNLHVCITFLPYKWQNFSHMVLERERASSLAENLSFQVRFLQYNVRVVPSSEQGTPLPGTPLLGTLWECSPPPPRYPHPQRPGRHRGRHREGWPRVGSCTVTPKHCSLSVIKNNQNMGVRRTNSCYFLAYSFFLFFFFFFLYSFSLFIVLHEGRTASGNPLQFLDKTFKRQSRTERSSSTEMTPNGSDPQTATV